jgi:hypothetical protein
MAIGKNKNVFTLAIHAKWLGLVFHYLKKQGGKVVGTAQRPARMSALYSMHHSYNISSYLCCRFLQRGHLLCFGRKSKVLTVVRLYFFGQCDKEKADAILPYGVNYHHSLNYSSINMGPSYLFC